MEKVHGAEELQHVEHRAYEEWHCKCMPTAFSGLYPTSFKQAMQWPMTSATVILVVFICLVSNYTLFGKRPSPLNQQSAPRNNQGQLLFSALFS